VIAAAIALIVIGLLLAPFLSYFSLIVSAVGIVLLILWLIGFGRRAAEGRP
jgi:hypothetical protein